MNEAGPLLGLAGLVVFIVLIGIWAQSKRQNFEELLKALAAPHGLTYGRIQYTTNVGATVGAGHQITGQLDGREFQLKVEPNGGVLGEAWIITLKTPLPEGFAAGKNGWMRRPSDGMTFLSTGDSDFDKKVFVEAKDPGSVSGLVTDARKEALRSLAKENGLVYGGKVMFQKSGFDTNPQKLGDRLAWLREVAAKLDA